MSELADFKMEGSIDGVEITPTTIDFTRFNEFNRQVELFLIGTDPVVGDRLQLHTVRSEVVPGSYVLRLSMSVAMIALVESKVRVLAHEDGLANLDDNRAKVVEKWQSKAKKHDRLSYEIRIMRSNGTSPPPVRIGRDTNFRRAEVDSWAPVETYLLGEIVDAGGLDPNIHIRLFESGDTLIVQTDRETLGSLEQNPLYKRALLRAEGQQNIKTGDFRNLKLREFVNYKAHYDEAALQRFIEKGREAWADVPDASEWVRDIRGG